MTESVWQSSSELGPDPEPPMDWRPEPSKTVLVVVDLQYASACRVTGSGKRWAELGWNKVCDYRFGRIEKLVIPNVQKLLKFFRDNGLKVLYLTVGSELPDFSDLSFKAKRTMMPINNTKGFREHEILDEIKPLEGEAVINKTSMGAFATTGIDALLRAFGAEFLLFTGVSTYACVYATAVAAADRGYKCTMLEDALSGSSKVLHEAILQNFARMLGRVETVNTILGEMRTQLVSNKGVRND